MAKPHEPARRSIANVGGISANNDRQIGDLLAEALEKVGNDGVITVEEGKTAETTLRGRRGDAVRQGLPFPLLHQPAPRDELLLEDALILIYEKKITNIRDLIPLLEKISSTGQAAADHLRGRRERGPHGAGGQQAPRRAATSAPSRPPASATAARPCWATSPS